MERLEKILNHSHLFSYWRSEDNLFRKLEKAIYEIAKESLLKDLESSHKKVLLHKHWHQPDPNDSHTGCNLALIDRLIGDACFWSMSVKGNQICISFSMGVIEYFTGIKEEEELTKILEEVNQIWEKKKIAKIQYKEKAIYFEILTFKTSE